MRNQTYSSKITLKSTDHVDISQSFAGSPTSISTDESYNGQKSSQGSPPPEYPKKTILDLDNTNHSIETYLESTPVVCPTGTDKKNAPIRRTI